MKMGLRVRLIGTIVIAILAFFVISVIAARSTMSRDLGNLSAQSVQNGAQGFAGYWDEKREQVRLLVLQASTQDRVKEDLTKRKVADLQSRLADIARSSGFSFLTVVDTKGNVMGRGTSSKLGKLGSNPYVSRALLGETVGTAAVLPPGELADDALAPQASVDVKDAAGKVAVRLEKGLAIVSAAPISDANYRTLGALYGGVLINHYYDVVDQATKALGGKSGIVLDGVLIASTLTRSDGTRLVDAELPATVRTKAEDIFNGVDTEGGTAYVAHIDPIKNDQNEVIGQRWYGVPKAEFDAIQDRTISSILIWGIAGLIVALLISVPVVEALSRSLISRSKQISQSANELAVIIVGTEVSGDHIAQTRQAVEKAGVVISELKAASAGGGGTATATKTKELEDLNNEILGDVIVIDTLAVEMNTRTKQAVSSVQQLQDVAGGLKELVTGTSE